MNAILPKKPKIGEAFRKVITIRKRTGTREPIRVIVSQMRTHDGLVLATITIESKFPPLIESPRFAKDIANTLVYAAMIAEERNELVNGHKR